MMKIWRRFLWKGRNNCVRKTILLMVSALVGCAITPDKARTLSAYDICSAYLHCFQGSENRLILEREIKVRGITCEAPSYYGVSCDDISKGLSRASQHFKQGNGTPTSQTTLPLLNQCVTTTDEDGNFIRTCR